MPENLLDSDYGIPKSTLSKITATKNDVSSGKYFLDTNGDIVSGTRTMLGKYKECAFCSLKIGYYSYSSVFTSSGSFSGGEDSSVRKGSYLQAQYHQNYNNSDYIDIVALVEGDYIVADGTYAYTTHATPGQRLAYKNNGSIAVCAI